MSKSFKRIISACAVTVLSLVMLCTAAFAEVFTESTGGGRADTVFVAGSSDRYPIEYYDRETESYKGLFPDILNEISKKTGISFTYISAGSHDRRKSLYKNRQVEMVTALADDEFGFGEIETVSVITVQNGEETVDYRIGFTDIIDEDIKSEIIDALSEINESEKTGYIIETAKKNNLRYLKKILIVSAVTVAVLLIAVGVVIAVVIKKKRKKQAMNRLIDLSTGVGNADYYGYCYDELISEQAKSLYTVILLAFNAAVYEGHQSGLMPSDIDKYAANKLNLMLNDREYVSHLESGCFALLLQAENAAIAEERTEAVVDGVNSYISEFSKSLSGLFKAGYCRLCDHLGADAETALFNAKQGYIYAEANGLKYHIGSKALSDENKRAEDLALQSDDALKNGEFKIYLQFICDGKTGRFCGAEALSRWQNSLYGLLKPHEYIDILSKTGKIVEHDYGVFEKVCRQLEAWNKPPFDKLFITCNFTRLSVSDPTFVDRLCEIAAGYDFDRSRLVIEVTEDVLSVNSKTVSDNIKRLSSLGFKVAIDDMGAGFSSFADIYDNVIDIVKIDRSFIISCVTEHRRQMMSDIISLVHNAGAKVVCEGIETEEQLLMLKGIDCDMMQGFYHSRVLPISECEKFLLSNLEKTSSKIQ